MEDSGDYVCRTTTDEYANTRIHVLDGEREYRQTDKQTGNYVCRTTTDE